MTSESTIIDAFSAVVRKHGDRPAVNDGSKILSYTELRSWARSLAFALAQNRVDSTAPVAIIAGQNVSAVAGMLAALMAGRPFSFLPSRTPQVEQVAILRELGAMILLADHAHARRAAQIATGRAAVHNIDEVAQDADLLTKPLPVSSAQMAAVYFTSGSTGRPKGVVHSHQSLLARLQAERSIHQEGPGGNLALLRRMNFAATAATIFHALLNGATLHPADPAAMTTREIIDWIMVRRISYLRISTALLRQILDVLPAGTVFQDLRYCRPAGRLLRQDVERLWLHLPHTCQVGHGLASTEGSLATHLTLERGSLPAGEVVPVGSPVAGAAISLVDEQGKRVPQEEVGEIVISSSLVAAGYWDGRTRRVQPFAQDEQLPGCRLFSSGDLGRWRPDGWLAFLGRKDNQAKIRGYRIELEAVEAALEQLPGVKQAAVQVFAGDSGDGLLVGYVVPQKEKSISTNTLRQQLADLVPGHMVPARLIALQDLPLGSTGKINRDALPDPDRQRPPLDIPYVAPRTATEIQLAGIWAELLDIDQIGVDDSFFDLGGQSLLVARISSRVLEEFGVDLPLQAFFAADTVALLAAQIDQRRHDPQPASDMHLDAQMRLLGY